MGIDAFPPILIQRGGRINLARFVRPARTPLRKRYSVFKDQRCRFVDCYRDVSLPGATPGKTEDVYQTIGHTLKPRDLAFASIQHHPNRHKSRKGEGQPGIIIF